MLAYSLLVTTVAAIIAAVSLRRPLGDDRRVRILQTAERDSGLALTGRVERRVLRRARRADRFALIGGLAGMVTLAWLPVHWPSSAGVGFFGMGAVAVGGAFGTGLAAFVDARTRPLIDRPRVARATAVSVADYVPAFERRSAWIAVAAITVGATVVWLGGTADPLILVGFPVLVAATALTGAIGARLIVAQPQHAATSDELAWDDALRARNLRTLVEAAPTAGYAGAAALLIGSTLVGDSLSIWTIVAVVVAVLLTLPLEVVRRRATPRPSQYYLTRLWPDRAAAHEQPVAG